MSAPFFISFYIALIFFVTTATIKDVRPSASLSLILI